MNPQLRPKCLITLINRESSTIYSGMFPGLISGLYQLDKASIDLRLLADRAGVSLVVGEIETLDLSQNRLFLQRRPSIEFSRLSLDVGSETFVDDSISQVIKNKSLSSPIRPFEKCLKWINCFDNSYIEEKHDPFTVIGSGLAALEMVFALRRRWPSRLLRLQAYEEKLNLSFRQQLSLAKIQITHPSSPILGPVLLCTGSQAPKWLKKSGLDANDFGRVKTNSNFLVRGRCDVFAVGDCGLLGKSKPPPSGVWAVRAAVPLAKNIERSLSKQSLLSWKPQKYALHLVGTHREQSSPIAWMLWGPFIFGPCRLFWEWKKKLDRGFMDKFINFEEMNESKDKQLPCRGCAAKMPFQPLQKALREAELSVLSDYPEDAALVRTSQDEGLWLQSVDGFPALVSDPWLNARLTTLHACSDIWARGAYVSSAQPVITIPSVGGFLQKEILTQCLLGIKSALKPQGAELIGGHTYESRSALDQNINLGIQISLSINGFLHSDCAPWSKGGLKPGDSILLSRGIGSGVIFAAAMQGTSSVSYVDSALLTLSESQHELIEKLQRKVIETSNPNLIHACTDVTGFGLIGHLSEMINATNLTRLKAKLPLIKVDIFGEAIPTFRGVKSLLEKGFESTLSPSNKSFLNLLNSKNKSSGYINLIGHNEYQDNHEIELIKRLLVDPQTCGPLMIACDPDDAEGLIKDSSWHQIGLVDLVQ